MRAFQVVEPTSIRSHKPRAIFFDDLTTRTFRRSSTQFTIWPAVFEPKKPSRKEAL